MLRDSAATEKVNEQVPSNDGNWGHGDTMLLLFNTQCVSWAGRNVGSVVKQDLTSLPTSDMTLGLNFLICTMGRVTVSTSGGVMRTKCKALGMALSLP